MTGFRFPRFSDRRNLTVPVPGEIVDLFADDFDIGADDTVALGPDVAPVTDLRVRAGIGPGRVYEVSE